MKRISADRSSIPVVVFGLALMAMNAATMFAGGGAEGSESSSVHHALANHRWQVIAHQGGNHLWPGDTMAAFTGAVALGVDALEMDVHATADGVLVVIHDDTVDRTTNGSGAVRELTFDEIRGLDAGYNWPLHRESDVYPFRGTGVKIPSLEEVLQEFPDVPMVIEIKQADPPIVEDFGALLRQYNRAENTIVASFHPQVMEEFRLAFPEFATAGVEPEIRRFFVLNTLLLGRLYRPQMEAFQVPETFGSLRVIRPRFVRVAQAKGIAVHAWTINTEEDMERILAAGVDGIMTDRPDLLVDLLR